MTAICKRAWYLYTFTLKGYNIKIQNSMYAIWNESHPFSFYSEVEVKATTTLLNFKIGWSCSDIFRDLTTWYILLPLVNVSNSLKKVVFGILSWFHQSFFGGLSVFLIDHLIFS